MLQPVVEAHLFKYCTYFWGTHVSLESFVISKVYFISCQGIVGCWLLLFYIWQVKFQQTEKKDNLIKPNTLKSRPIFSHSSTKETFPFKLFRFKKCKCIKQFTKKKKKKNKIRTYVWLQKTLCNLRPHFSEKSPSINYSFTWNESWK